MNERELREKIARQMLEEIGPLIQVDKSEGGYDCCGCSTYYDILNHAVRIALGKEKA